MAKADNGSTRKHQAAESTSVQESRPGPGVHDTEQRTPAGERRFIPDIFSHSFSYRRQIPLKGPWEFRRDATSVGEQHGWHKGNGEFQDRIQVPGAPQAQGFGEPTEKVKTHFGGPFWVRRTFALPKLDAEQRVWLRVGGVQPAARIYLNGSCVGYTKSSRTQQRVDVTDLVRPGAKNLVAVKICKYPEVRLDGLWELQEFASASCTGIYGQISCEITGRVSLIDAYVRPELATGSVQVSFDLSEPPAMPLACSLQVTDGRGVQGEIHMDIPTGQTHAEATVRLETFTTWTPDHPKLYMLEVTLADTRDGVAIDKAGIQFGMREIAVKGRRFYLNGSPVFLRFFGDDHSYPKTLFAPADKNWFVPRLKLARQYGMNGVKSCVETLTQEYVEAADEVGLLVVQEMPFGLSGLRENRHVIDERFRRYYSEELDGLVKVSRNHASVIAYSMSSELEFPKQTQESFDFFGRDLVEQTRKLAPHALVVDCTGSYAPHSLETAKGKRSTDFYVPTVHKGMLNRPDIETDGLRPVLLHEYNWWGCYPDSTAREQFEKTQIRPYWLEALVRSARENGQEELLPLYHRNSLWLQALCRKEGVEFARLHPNVEGYILWLLIDFQWASEGLLDDFWKPKNVSPREFLKSNGDTVVLLPNDGNRCLKMGEQTEVALAVSHYGERPIAGGELRWKLSGGPASQSGTLPMPELKPGQLAPVGAATFTPAGAAEAYKFELEVALHHGSEILNTNNWSFWTFPEVGRELHDLVQDGPAGKMTEHGAFFRIGPARAESIPPAARVVIAETVDQALAEYLEAGGRCLLFPREAVINTTGPYYQVFRTIPWNRGDRGNSGTVISRHPALEGFPHEGRCDLQFLRMIQGFCAMDFGPLVGCDVEPIVRVIDHYRANRNIAYMLQFKVGRGRALATSLGGLRQARECIEARVLLDRLIDYAGSDRFEPSAEVPPDEFHRLFRAR